MTHFELIIESFRKRNWVATLGELLEDGRYTFAAEYRARISDLRRRGYTIKCERSKIPSDNVYKMTPPYINHYSVAENGQMEMFI